MPKVRKKLSFPRGEQPQGFSLVELLVVILVILVLGAITIPRMLQARMKANEASAIASMRVIHEAEEMYHTSYPAVGYSGNLADLGSHGSNCESTSKTNACLIMDNALSSGLKSGYIFELVGDGNTPSLAYTLTATPQSLGNSGRCVFVSDASGIVRQAANSPSDKSRFSTVVNSVSGCDTSSF
jgi:prepilin-type N-terminal cleavage/methylation domain-containing protein